jgi:hypothetical protein
MEAELFFGLNEHLDVMSALEDVPPEAIERVLLTTVDSDLDVARIVRRLGDLGRDFRVLGAGVSVALPVMNLLALEFNLMNGFDELWLSAGEPAVEKPAALRLTSDHELTAGLANEAEGWMREAGIHTGLGDGLGLNWITFEPDLAERWTV